MAYTTYKFYTEQFMGNTIPEPDFNRLAERASEYVDFITMGKASVYNDKLNKVQRACCAAAEIIQVNENGGAILSETVGPWSRTYLASGKSQDRALYDVACRYLAPIGLMYRGN